MGAYSRFLRVVMGGATAVALSWGAASAQELKIALIAGKTGPLEAYAKQTEAGFMMGLEYLTKGSMELNGRKIRVIVKDDQLKPDLAKSLLEQAYGDDKVDIAVGTTSLRLIESAAGEDGVIRPFEGDTAIFITPGYRFRGIDGLMTNFHLPKSTLFMLVSALMGRERMLAR